MRYVALLRAINVGGRSKVEMPRLRACLQHAGFEDVSTYINSGNVLFDTKAKDRTRLVKKIEGCIEDEFGFRVPVILRTHDEIARVTRSVPSTWSTNARMQCNVMFLLPKVDSRTVLMDVPTQRGVDDLRYVPGALVWRVDRAKIGKSLVRTMIGSDLYKSLTIRNINTVRKLTDLSKSGR